ncbi:MAG: long-chain fatty acid--CoA ligase [Bacteroidales bacterium]|nr:MAG: long-chain fatty acid--CoA ligase [Bacteroidales bacterium]
MEITRTFDILDNYKTAYSGKEDALVAKEKGLWNKYSADDYINNAYNISYGLLSLGLIKGDRIATISNNRPEWNFMDMGLSQAGILHVPIYPTISNDDYDYILRDCDPKLIIVSDNLLYQRIKPIAGNIPGIKDIYSFNEIKGVKNWKEIIELGKKNRNKYISDLKSIKESIKPDETVTLLYTSGTTGNPKGVLLSHNNIISNIKSVSKVFHFNEKHRTLSFLPINHIFERTVNYYFQTRGISIYYAENLGTIADNIREVKPNLFVTVPRLLEKVYDKIIAKGKELKGIKKQIFFWAVRLGLRYKLNKENGWFYHLKLGIADKLVFRKWREALGGNIDLIVSGGAALQPRLARVFNAAGITLIEGYGLTETSPVIAVNNITTNEIKIGTVGPALNGVEIKISDDGEILCRGPNVMQGYYKNTELTKQVIDDEGWFHTGDIGILEEDKYLKITDRKKEIFKLSSGKYVSPQVIENRFKESVFIEQIMVVGENQKFASALISPNFLFLHNWCSSNGISYRDNKELIQNEKVLEIYQNEINNLNKKLGQAEQIKRFRLVQDEWSPLTGELSPTLKLKRKFLIEKYSDILKEIFSASVSA